MKQGKKEKRLHLMVEIDITIGGTIHLLKSRLPRDSDAIRAITFLEDARKELKELRKTFDFSKS